MIDYCDAPDEEEKNRHMREWFFKLANGDRAAFEFMWAFWNWTHVFDDLVDRDKIPTIEEATRAFIRFIEQLSFNQFYVRNVAALFPLMAMVGVRWLDGDEWKKSGDVYKQDSSHVVRCGDIDLYLMVAYLVGGWDHLMAAPEVAAGRLFVVPDSPRYRHPAYLVHPLDSDSPVLERAVAALREMAKDLA